jgi:hypothetical protein
MRSVVNFGYKPVNDRDLLQMHLGCVYGVYPVCMWRDERADRDHPPAIVNLHHCIVTYMRSSACPPILVFQRGSGNLSRIHDAGFAHA